MKNLLPSSLHRVLGPVAAAVASFAASPLAHAVADIDPHSLHGSADTSAAGVAHPAVPGKSTIREDTFEVAATPERVFPLLCPVREYDWLPGWQCDVLSTASGVAELECTFRTVRKDSGTMTWVVTRYEPPHVIEFTCFNPGTEHVMRLTIQLEPTSDGGTRLLWRRRWISTGPAGDVVIDTFQERAHVDMMRNLQRLLSEYLRTGEMAKD